MDILEVIELEVIEFAKKSEYGCTWFSDKGPIYVSKEGKLYPVQLMPLPIFPELRNENMDEENEE